MCGTLAYGKLKTLSDKPGDVEAKAFGNTMTYTRVEAKAEKLDDTFAMWAPRN